MDLHNKDFSLNFRGFEHDDPETVKRFAAFCEANFALPPDKVCLLNSSPETVVLTQGGSLDQLEALAKVLREIGARVEVCEDDSASFPTLIGAPTTQDLHRLFAGNLDRDSSDDAAPSCPYPPPLGRSLYFLNNSNLIVDRRSLRKKTQLEIRSPKAPTTAPRRRMLLAFTCIVLGVVLVALGAAALMMNTPSATELGAKDGARIQALRAQPSQGQISSAVLNSTQTLTATTESQGMTVDLKVVASTNALSISSLTFTPLSDVAKKGGIQRDATIRQIIAEPTFLNKVSQTEWKGSILLSVFVDETGQSSHFTTPAEVTVQINNDQSIAHATIRATNNSQVHSDVVAVSRRNSSTWELRGLASVELKTLAG